MDRRFLIVLAILILGLGGLLVFTRNKATAPGSSDTASASNHVRDIGANGVELLIYGDFQCSVCKPFYYVEKQVLDKYPGQIRLTFRNFPLDSIHPNARAAARAAEAAGLQDMFFEMHDMLYENQDNWSALSSPQSTFEEYATNLGLDIAKFKTDLVSEAVNDTINADRKDGEDRGVEGTPTYFLNGEKLNNSDIGTVETFSAKIESALLSANN
jgi:protein-disulfide isomerase